MRRERRFETGSYNSQPIDGAWITPGFTNEAQLVNDVLRFVVRSVSFMRTTYERPY